MTHWGCEGSPGEGYRSAGVLRSSSQSDSFRVEALRRLYRHSPVRGYLNGNGALGTVWCHDNRITRCEVWRRSKNSSPPCGLSRVRLDPLGSPRSPEPSTFPPPVAAIRTSRYVERVPRDRDLPNDPRIPILSPRRARYRTNFLQKSRSTERVPATASRARRLSRRFAGPRAEFAVTDRRYSRATGHSEKPAGNIIPAIYNFFRCGRKPQKRISRESREIYSIRQNLRRQMYVHKFLDALFFRSIRRAAMNS